MSEPVEKKEPGPTDEKVTDTTPASGNVPVEKRKREYKDFGHENEEATRKSLSLFWDGSESHITARSRHRCTR